MSEKENNMTVGMYGGKFLPFHLGHAYMVDVCSKKVDKLYVVLSSSEKRDKEICKRDGVKYMPAEVRMSWIGEYVSGMDGVEVINIKDDWSDEDYDWWKGAEMIVDAIPEKITHIFSSEPDYDKFFRNFYDAEHIVIDAARKIVSISATTIRRNVDTHEYFTMLPHIVRPFFVKKIAIVGTESVGKSTLTRNLASHYKTQYVHEVGRDYCERYDDNLTIDIFDDIAIDHYRLTRDKLGISNRFIFIDSEAVVTQYYLNMYFKTQSSLIDEIIKKQDFDLVLYLEPDVPWIDDGLRFSGKDEERKENNLFLKQLFAKYGIQYKIIKGGWDERFNKAVKLINQLDS